MGGVLGIMLSNQNQTVSSVTATGGQTIYDGTGAYAGYRFHVFTSPGTFTVTSNPANKTFAAVIVGGGGATVRAASEGNGGGGGGGGAVTQVTGLSLTTNSPYDVVVGAGGYMAEQPSFVPLPPAPGMAGQSSSWNGYSAAGGTRGYGGAGVSGNGNPGGIQNEIPSIAPARSGAGGGGAGGIGRDSRSWGGSTYPPSSPVYPSFVAQNYPTPYSLYMGTKQYAGSGGIGVTSTIDGITYGAGGGGAHRTNPTYTNFYYTPEANIADTAGIEFVPGGGGGSNNPGVNGKGGGAGGIETGGTAVKGFTGGSGTVVIRYPYP
jgi:hypothetical protein